MTGWEQGRLRVFEDHGVELCQPAMETDVDTTGIIEFGDEVLDADMDFKFHVTTITVSERENS